MFHAAVGEGADHLSELSHAQPDDSSASSIRGRFTSAATAMMRLTPLASFPGE
jgi:hypothetical protein